jgi:hypothetical protein
MLLLARIDGKSPVEYLTGGQKMDFVRNFVSSRLSASSLTLEELARAWFTRLQTRI